MPYGPHKITRVRQVAIPGELLRAVGLELGDNVHFRLSESDPHVIEIVPSDIVARRYQAGAESETLERLSQPQPLMTSLPTATIPGHTTQTAECNEPGHLVGQRTRRLHQSAADALIDDLLAVIFPAAKAPPQFPVCRLDEEGQPVRPGFSRRPALVLHGVGCARLACERSLLLVTDSQQRLRCAGDLAKITGTRLAISPDRQLCWLWRSLLVAGRARKPPHRHGCSVSRGPM